jgi:hypothetical protein
MLQPGIGSHCKKGKENKEIKVWGGGRGHMGHVICLICNIRRRGKLNGR